MTPSAFERQEILPGSTGTSSFGAMPKERRRRRIERNLRDSDLPAEKTLATLSRKRLPRCIIEMHGGRISAESAPGKGSIISFALPSA